MNTYDEGGVVIAIEITLGAAIAGAEPALSKAYSGFGLPLGEAFQLRDDVLGVFGDGACSEKGSG